MAVQITNIPKGVIPNGESSIKMDSPNISLSPGGDYAVIEIFHNELFIAVNVLFCDQESLSGEYVDHFLYFDDKPMLMRFTTDWNNIKYGFGKLVLWAPEKANEFGGSFDKTVKRFYFDWDLYKRSYEELHGVPFKKKRPER